MRGKLRRIQWLKWAGRQWNRVPGPSKIVWDCLGAHWRY